MTMKLLILRQTSITGQPVRAGDVIEVNDRDGRQLINSGKAEPATAPAAPAAAPVAQDAEPVQRKRPRRTKTNGPT